MSGLFDLLCSVSFAYLMGSAASAIWTSHSLAARISVFGFLIPHATKVLLWTSLSLFWLKPRFGWRYPFAMFMLYCAAEASTNLIYITVHWQNLASAFSTPGYDLNAYVIFGIAQAFFASGIVLGLVFLKDRFVLSLDWSMIPFAVLIGFWVFQGYQTESTVVFPSYFLEFEEFAWNALYLLMITQIFRPRTQAIQIDGARPFVG